MNDSENTDREIMKRTIAMLFSFASMAEGAALRSYFARCFMLWILRRALVSAQRYVNGYEDGRRHGSLCTATRQLKHYTLPLPSGRWLRS